MRKVQQVAGGTITIEKGRGSRRWILVEPLIKVTAHA